MIVSAVDVGSYSIRLGVAKTDPFDIVYERGCIVELGSNVKQTGFLEEDKIEKAIQIIKEFKNISQEMGAQKIIAIGTEALRKAKNAKDFIRKVYNETGIEINIISGEEEGRLSYLASIYSLNLNTRGVVIDQGGGSTEYIFGKGLEVKEVNSMPFGIVSLTEEFLKTDPPKEDEIKALFDFLDKSLKHILKPVDLVVGIGGTITTIGALHYHIYPYNGKIIHGKILSFKMIEDWFWTLARKSIKERQTYKEIEDKRAKAIVSGIGIFYKTLELFRKDYLVVSDFGLKHAILLKAAGII